jgi:hypothetical protein
MDVKDPLGPHQNFLKKAKNKILKSEIGRACWYRAEPP